MELEYNQSSDIGLGILSVLHRADQEIAKLKRGSLSTKSRYWKPIRKQDHETSKVGVRLQTFSEGNLRGVYDEWNRGYEYFCNQKVNTKGQKVNREQLKRYGMGGKFSYGVNDEIEPNEDSSKKRKN